MNSKRMLRPIVVIATLVLVLGMAGSLWADVITGFNQRPVPVLPPSVGSELTLQQILDNNFGGINAANDQQTAGVFATAGNPPFSASNYPTLLAEFSGNADIHTFGLWSATDTNGPINTAQIFSGPAVPGAMAQVVWNNATSGTITSGGNTTNFTGISNTFFGFYYQFGNTTLYSYDALNTPQAVGGFNDAHTAAILAFKTLSGDAWIFACDDLGVEPDYNDLVVKVESIHAVPLPPSVLLMGSGLLGLVGLGWRRRKS